jgi:acetyltransferase-like isoleucine patch superfamily enzyme
MQIGPHTYHGAGCSFSEFEGHITIGDYCSLGEAITIIAGGEHHTEAVSSYPFAVKFGVGELAGFSRGDVNIGSDVWIGSHTIILPGVTIGHGAVIGAGAVVPRSVPDYAVAVGNPARVVRKRFDDVTIARLISTAWWTWPENVLRERIPLMTDVQAFLEAAGC